MTVNNPTQSFLATRRGNLTLVLLCMVAFVDFVNGPIVNQALPSIRHTLHFSVQNLQWVPSAYLLTYGGCMLLGGRAADLLGRRRVLVTGTVVLGLSSLLGGMATTSDMLVTARLAQGFGAAMMLPAGLSILTTSFTDDKDRYAALGAWGAVGGLASASGVLLGGLLAGGPGWRWVMDVNPIVCAILLGPMFCLISSERPSSRRGFDFIGAVLATGGMLLLVYTLVKAPDVGWMKTWTIAEISGATVLLVAFAVNETRVRNPLAPLSLLRINGLGFADATMLLAFAGFLGIFFFLTLYMQSVLGYSPVRAGMAYLPLTFASAAASAASSRLLGRIGTRPGMVSGAIVTAGGVFWLSHLRVHASLIGMTPGMLLVGIGMGTMFVAVTTAANAGVPPDKAGLAAALVTTSQQLGGALGLAIFTAMATSRTNYLLHRHTPLPRALVSGFSEALLAASLFVAAAALVALRATNVRSCTVPRHTARQRGASPYASPSAEPVPSEEVVPV